MKTCFRKCIVISIGALIAVCCIALIIARVKKTNGGITYLTGRNLSHPVPSVAEHEYHADSVQLFLDESEWSLWDRQELLFVDGYNETERKHFGGECIVPAEMEAESGRYQALILDNGAIAAVHNENSDLFILNNNKWITVSYGDEMSFTNGKTFFTLYDFTGDGIGEYIACSYESDYSVGGAIVIDTEKPGVIEYEKSDKYIYDVAEKYINEYYAKENKSVDGYIYELSDKGYNKFDFIGRLPNDEKVEIVQEMYILYGPEKDIKYAREEHVIGVVTVVYGYDDTAEKMKVCDCFVETTEAYTERQIKRRQ